VREIHRRFAKDGVIVIGVHSPEFTHERDARAVARAVRTHRIAYPVALDNDHAIWRAFGIRAWPTLVLLDKNGRVRRTHVGELHLRTARWDTFVQSIRELTGDTSCVEDPPPQRLAFGRNPAHPDRL
jgi:alkyl hydroperoxide reductase subunit AhpC